MRATGLVTVVTAIDRSLKALVDPCRRRVRYLVVPAIALLALANVASAETTGFPGRNVNIIGPPPPSSGQHEDFGFRQQNEPSCAVNPKNTDQVCCGFNDYRGIDLPKLGDAWEGLACSRDGGERWESELAPGSRADPNYSLNLDFAADPSLVSVPGGLFFNFIAADRTDDTGGVYIQRYAWRNKEDGWPLEQVGGPILISKGTSGRFIDKPAMMGFLDDSSSGTVTMQWTDATGATQTRELPAGHLGVAAAIFTGNDNNPGTKILYWNSDDWGATWDHPTKLTESQEINSGISLAANGNHICAVWRRFADVNQSDAILYACSDDGGQTFAKSQVVSNICPFDQSTLNGITPDPADIVSFRTNAFPAIASDGTNFYVFWADRGYAAASNYQAGCNLTAPDGGFNPSYGRIVYSVTSDNGNSWSAPKAVEDAPAGHQFMPAAFGANGQVVVSWIDSRDDIAHFLPIDKQRLVDFWKGGQALYRHTTDIRASRLQLSGGNISFTPSVKISRYTSGLILAGGQVLVRQLEYNLVNARLFQQGTAPFIGDYLSVTAPQAKKDGSGNWVNSNADITPGSPVFHIAWTDNRDVRGNAWGGADANGFNAPSPYTPSNNNMVTATDTTAADADASTTPGVPDSSNSQQIACSAATVKEDRTRDQNVYSAALYPDVVLLSPGAIKVKGGVQRALPVSIQNYASDTRYFRLTIEGQPSDYSACTGVASFRQTAAPGHENDCPLNALTSVWVKVYPYSSAVRTVFETSSASTLPAIPVSASLCDVSNGQLSTANCQVVSRITLNQDPLGSGNYLEQPNSSTASILSEELHNPDLLNPDLLDPQLVSVLLQNPGLLSSGLFNSNLLNPNIINPDLLQLILANPNLLNKDLLNQLIQNPDILDPTLVNQLVVNPTLLTPDLLNLLVANTNLLATIVANPDFLNPNLLNLLIANPNLTQQELQNLSVANPDVLTPDLLNLLIANPDLMNPDLLNVALKNPDLLNPNLLNTSVLNTLVANPDLLNPDLLNVIAANPDLLNPDLLNPDLLNLNLENPDLLNPDLMNPDLLNPDLLNPDLLNPDLLNLVLLNPDLLNPDLLNPDLLNPDLLNPDLLNPDLLNQLVANPDLMNPDFLNPDLLNPDLMNPDLQDTVVDYSKIENPQVSNPDLPDTSNMHYIDVTWQVKNSGNTTTGYVAQPYVAGPNNYAATQLIVSKPYLHLTTRDCNPVVESSNQVVVNIVSLPNQAPITNPDPADPSTIGLASYWLAPGEVANVTLRIFAGDASKLHSGRAGLYVSSEACNTGSGCTTQPYAETTRTADFTGPVMTPSSLPNITGVQATGPQGAQVSFTVPTAYDQGDAKSEPVTCIIPSGAYFPVGTNKDTCSASDSAGNVTSISFTIGVVDTTPPTLNLPGNLTAEATGPSGATVSYAASASDLVDGSVPVDCSPASGSVFPLGSTTVNCSATDNAGNTAQGSFTVQVADTTPPALTLPSNLVVEATGPSGATVSYTASASDLVDGSVPVDCSPVSGSVFPLGSTTVKCSATDKAGNVAQGSFTVKVADTTPPALTLPADNPIVVEATGPSGATVNFTVSANDLVSGTVAVDCTPTSGSVFPLGSTTVNCSATDTAGNTAQGSFTVKVQDTTPPVLNLPAADIVVDATSSSGAVVSFTVTATDIVDTSVNVVCTPSSGSLFEIGRTWVTCVATDEVGLTATGKFMVIVGIPIIWITPTADPYTASLGPNLNLRWGYGIDGVLQDSQTILNASGSGTDPIAIKYLGSDCKSPNPEVVNLDAGNSSLRYSSDTWQLNWQTGQSTLNGQPLVAGCYQVEIPRAIGSVDTKTIILTQ